jgi:hypothetical protein
MRGEPLHLCTNGHTPIFHREPLCPFCVLLAELAAARLRCAALETECLAARLRAEPALNQKET